MEELAFISSLLVTQTKTHISNKTEKYITNTTSKYAALEYSQPASWVPTTKCQIKYRPYHAVIRGSCYH
jgi:hypothetical protein